MILEILNWIACLLTIAGTWEVSKKNPNILKVNRLYLFGCIILIGIFLVNLNPAMLCMYIILLGFAIQGIRNHKPLPKKTLAQEFPLPQYMIENIWKENEKEWIDPDF